MILSLLFLVIGLILYDLFNYIYRQVYIRRLKKGVQELNDVLNSPHISYLDPDWFLQTDDFDKI